MKDIFWVEESSGNPPVCIKRKRRARKRKIEFVGWVSRPLFEFLEAIGQDTAKKHSQHDVAAFITKYIKDNSLTSAEKKKKVLCDERLYTLFGKKSMSRMKVFEMLEEHFVENHNDSDSEFLDTSEEEDFRENVSPGLRNNATIQVKKALKTHRSSFAAIVPDNIKLIYLKKSLLQELLKFPESFECKIMGSFVRMKSDPNDIYQKNRFQLQQVTGVEKVPGIGDANIEINLRVSNFFKDVPICELSDDNFSEEEVVDLQDRIKAGLLKRLTVSELELKAKMLHVDITKHWIAKELPLLQNLIDRANEKGWRRELFEYLERRKMLQTPSEQEKLLNKVPEVISEEPETEDIAAVASEKTRSNSPPTSTVRGSSDLSRAGSGNIVTPFQLNSDAHVVRNGGINGFVPVNDSDGYLHASETPETASQDNNTVDHRADSIQPETMVPSGSNRTVFSEETNSEDRPAQVAYSNHTPIQQEKMDPNGSNRTMFSGETNPSGQTADGNHTSTPIPVIELSDDEDDPNPNGEDPDEEIWYYIDPRGGKQGPFSLHMLKRWRDANYFHPGFMVWRDCHLSSCDGILLADVLRRTFPPN